MQLGKTEQSRVERERGAAAAAGGGGGGSRDGGREEVERKSC